MFNKNRLAALRASGGVAVFVHNSLPSEQIPLATRLEAVAVRVSSRVKITVCSLYLPDSQQLSLSDLDNLIKQLPTPLLLMGDFNARNTLWGSPTTDHRGRLMEDFSISSNLILLNTNKSTHFSAASGTFSSIDLSFCSPTIASSATWEVLDDLCDSDHFPIKIIADTDGNHSISIPDRWNLKTTNWQAYSDDIAREVRDLVLPENIDEAVTKVNSIILDAATIHIGKITASSKNKAVPWWNADCKNAIQASKRALNRFKRHPSQENLIIFKKLRAVSRRIVRKSKTETWQKYTSSLTSQTTPSEVWNKIARIKGQHRSTPIRTMEDAIGNSSSSSRDIANILATNFCEISRNSNYSQNFIQYREEAERITTLQYDDTDHLPLNLPFTLKELVAEIHSYHVAAAGPDDIPAIFIKKLPQEALHTILKVFNSIWSKQLFPDIWRQAIIIPIHKPGQPRNKPSSYRPISLTCNLCKIMEKMVNKRLLWLLETKNLLSAYQSGFRPNRSTMDNLVTLHTDISDAFVKQQDTLAVFF